MQRGEPAQSKVLIQALYIDWYSYYTHFALAKSRLRRLSKHRWRNYKPHKPPNCATFQRLWNRILGLISCVRIFCKRCTIVSRRYYCLVHLQIHTSSPPSADPGHLGAMSTFVNTTNCDYPSLDPGLSNENVTQSVCGIIGAWNESSSILNTGCCDANSSLDYYEPRPCSVFCATSKNQTEWTQCLLQHPYDGTPPLSTWCRQPLSTTKSMASSGGIDLGWRALATFLVIMVLRRITKL